LWNIVDAHGACEVKGRGSATWEIYDNTFKLIPWIDQVINLRGGQGVVFNNTFTGVYTPRHPIAVTDYAVCVGNCTQSCTVYPCPDMINHAYFWNNKIRTSSVNPVNNCSGFIKLNRDYFIGTMPGYVPYTFPHPLTTSSLRKEAEVEITMMPAEETSVHQNRHGIATIDYTLIDNAPVNIVVYTINGVLISTLVNGIKPAGNHSISWNSANVSSGVYVIKSTIGKIRNEYTLVK
jgi:hypothetical protein